MNERKWRKPWFQLHLITKSHGRQRELGLPTSSAVNIILENDAACGVLIYSNFLCRHIYRTFPLPPPPPPPTDRLWKIIFICSLYRLSATFKLLHHFGFVRSRLCCTHFLYRWHKIHNVLHHFMQICKRQCDPWLINSLVCWFHKSALDLVLFQISITSLYIGWLMVTIICSCGRLMVIVICSCGCLWVIVICSCGWLMVIIICSCGCLWVIVICSCGCLWVSVCCL